MPPETSRLSARLIICKTSRLGIVRDTQKLCKLRAGLLHTRARVSELYCGCGGVSETLKKEKQ